jgi:hypothetical protein
MTIIFIIISSIILTGIIIAGARMIAADYLFMANAYEGLHLYDAAIASYTNKPALDPGSTDIKNSLIKNY